MVGGHRLTLGMHLLHHLQSARRFTELLTTKFHHMQQIKCMSIFNQQLKVIMMQFYFLFLFTHLFTCLLCTCFQDQVESKPYLFPFMQVDDSSVLSKLYQQVKYAMLKIHESRGSQAAVDQLLKAADDW